MATVLHRVPVARINAEATEVRPGRAVVTLLLGVLWALGWLAGKIVSIVGVAATSAFAAVKVGWQDGRRARPGPPSTRAEVVVPDVAKTIQPRREAAVGGG